MNLWHRFLMLLRIRSTKALDRAEDPRDTLDYSYERQLDLQQKMRQGVADVVTARRRLEMQSRQLESSQERLERQARQALGQGRDDLAREALARRIMAAGEVAELQGQLEALGHEESKLTDAARRLDLQIQQFRTRKEAMKATYSAAEARARVGESVAGLGAEDGELVKAVQRAEDKIAGLQARADALDGLMASGALNDAAVSRDRIQTELDLKENQQLVDRELARLKGELDGHPALEESPQQPA